MAGEREKALNVLEELKALEKRRYFSAYDFAILYVGLEDTEQAFTWLEKAYEERSSLMASLKVDPVFENLRSDPRFVSLLKRIGLEK